MIRVYYCEVVQNRAKVIRIPSSQDRFQHKDLRPDRNPAFEDWPSLLVAACLVQGIVDPDEQETP